MGHERLSQYTRDEKFKRTENMINVHNNMKTSKDQMKKIIKRRQHSHL